LKKQWAIRFFGLIWILSILCMVIGSNMCPRGDTQPCQRDCQQVDPSEYVACTQEETRLHGKNRAILFFGWFGFTFACAVLGCLYLFECTWIRKRLERMNWIDPDPIGIV